MTDTLTLAESVLPPYVILAIAPATNLVKPAVLTINDEAQILLEAFTYAENPESHQIQAALEKRHPGANFVCLSPQIMIRLFSALKLSDDGSVQHHDVFEKSTRQKPTEADVINAMNGILTADPLLKLLVANYQLRAHAEIDQTSVEATRQMLKRFYDEAKSTSFNVLPDVVETYFGALMALMGIEEDEQ